MKALHDTTQIVQVQSAAMDLAVRVAGLFEQYPMLCGFSVQEPSTLTKDRARVRLPGGLWLADVSVSTPPRLRATQAFCIQIAYPLFELMEDQPEVCGLLPGRTFARTLH
jgi:hypothetical protein